MKPLKFLKPLSFVYLFFFNISQMIRKAKQKKLNCKVISVGNISVGGTGKTPLVIFLADLLSKTRKKVCVVSRGYKSKIKNNNPVTVSDGKRVFLGPTISGDEAYLSARSLKNVPVVIGRDRYKAGHFAIEKFGTDTIILDDGLQYLGLYRNLDIVCINALNPFGDFLLLPAGYLREPVKGLSRADVIVITRSNQVPDEKIQEIEATIRKYKKDIPVFHAYFSKNIFDRNGNKVEISTLQEKNVIAISGIAVPEDFEKTIKELGLNLLGHKKYPDHYFFKDRDIGKFYGDAAEFQAAIITTSKDATRLPEDFPCYVLDVKLEIKEKQEFAKFL